MKEKGKLIESPQQTGESTRPEFEQWAAGRKFTLKYSEGSDGYPVATTQAAWLAWQARAELRETESPGQPSADEQMPLVCLHGIPLDYHCAKCKKESRGTNRRIAIRSDWQKKYEACLIEYNKLTSLSQHPGPARAIELLVSVRDYSVNENGVCAVCLTDPHSSGCVIELVEKFVQELDDKGEHPEPTRGGTE